MGKRKNLNFKFLILILGFLIFPAFAQAHPGGVDANGCHVCRSKCENYNVPYNEKHCHQKNGTSTSALPPPQAVGMPTSQEANVGAVPNPVTKPALKKSEPKEVVEEKFATITSPQREIISATPFFTKSSILLFSSAAGIGLLAGLGFISITKKP